MASKTPTLNHVLEHSLPGVEFVARLMGVHDKVPAYMVELGDCAAEIAVKHGIDPRRWRELYEANGIPVEEAKPARIVGGYHLSATPARGRTFRVGEVLILPEGWRRAF